VGRSVDCSCGPACVVIIRALGHGGTCPTAGVPGPVPELVAQLESALEDLRTLSRIPRGINEFVMRCRFWFEALTAVGSVGFFLLTVLWINWIELLFGLDPSMPTAPLSGAQPTDVLVAEYLSMSDSPSR
jgi:hypothetical protein